MRYIFIVLFLVSFGSVSMGGIGDIIFCEMDETSGLDEFGLSFIAFRVCDSASCNLPKFLKISPRLQYASAKYGLISIALRYHFSASPNLSNPCKIAP